MALLRKFVSLCLACLVAGCAADRARLDDYPMSGSVEVMVRTIGYDDKGLPVLGPWLAERPSTPGEHFTVARLAADRPTVSCDIAVVRQKPDLSKPFQAVYEWTGKGFELGLNATGGVVYNSSQVHPQNRDEAVLELAVLVTPLALGTVGGFVVGLADGIRQTAVELGKVVTKGEEAVTCITYEYDALNRLMFMRMFTPDRSRELVRTEFVYEGAAIVPSRTVVTSLVEGKKRDIRPKQ